MSSHFVSIVLSSEKSVLLVLLVAHRSLQSETVADIYFPQLEPTARGSSEPFQRQLRPTPARLELENLRRTFSNLRLSPEDFFTSAVDQDTSHYFVPLPDSPTSSNSSVDLHLTPRSDPTSDSRPPTKSSDIEEVLPSYRHFPSFTTSPFISTLSSLTTSSSSSPVHIPSSLPAPVIAPVTVVTSTPRVIPVLIMSTNPYQMPIRGTANAPKFDGTIVDISRYFDDFDQHADNANLTLKPRIKAALRYISRDDAETWETLPEASGDDYAAFVTAIKDQLYPG
ncbi:hypothetical protein M405DRAFT_869258 [Rhizopogon salebrosus TDB-379]|nr:hypothetical protein M405DRAFT_869258 [Rhizopogon salebrosus TDB-379]